MEKINLRDINFEQLRKLSNQGTKSTIYTDGAYCIKMLNGLYPEERNSLYWKFLEMDGISIDSVVLPNSLIIKDDKLVGYTMEYLKGYQSFFDEFSTTQYVSIKKMFSAVKQSSLILREIHSNDIICQDLTFDNILIDANGNIKYCDIDGCAYNHHLSSFVSVLLKQYIINYRKEKQVCVSKNMDRLSLMLSFFLLTYLKEIQKTSQKNYQSLSEHLKTLENCRQYAEILTTKRMSIPEIPYIDELIDDNDSGYLNRDKQLNLIKKIIRR